MAEKRSDRSIPLVDNEDESPSSKRTKLSHHHPRTFVTWNCNGFTSRCLYNQSSLRKLLNDTESADVYCLQEVRMKASGADRSQPLPSEYQGAVETTLRDIFGEYRAYWSLADKRYAGTLTLLHKRLGTPQGTAFTTECALNLLLQNFGLKREDCGIPSDIKSSLPKKKTNQSSIKSFFTAKPSSKLSTNSHDADGRFQFFLFHGMDFIQTYVPNNGDKPEKYQRRREWDEAMESFLAFRKRVYQKAGTPEPMLLWCGDLNVAREHRDGTHWERRNDECIYEWWTDESKCLTQRPSNNNNTQKHPDNVGIASFTPAERRRFNTILEKNDLCDVWRTLHPDGAINEKVLYDSVWEHPSFTWRGHLSKDPTRQSKYEGKGQRLDYFLLSPPSAAEQVVESCDILGYGGLREGLFCGSDHCAVSLILKQSTTG